MPANSLDYCEAVLIASHYQKPWTPMLNGPLRRSS